MKRFNNLGILSVVLLAFAMTSCGGSSGGGDKEIEFEQKDLFNKVWYANRFFANKYEANDAVLVYRFEEDGQLRREQFSGKRDKVVGSWSLIDDLLEIKDNTENGGAAEKWYIQSGSSSNLLNLSSSGGKREFRTSIDGLSDVTADAYWVNDLRLVNGVYESNYRVDYEVYGKDLSEVVAMYSSTKKESLLGTVDYKLDKVFVLSNAGLQRYFDVFGGAQSVRFYLKTKADDEFKLDENLDNKNIAVLSSNRGYVQNTHNVTWMAIDESEISYTVEILSLDDDIRSPLFKSKPQPADPGQEKSLKISEDIDATIRLNNNMVIGENYFIRITGVRYEEGIDPVNSLNRLYNIQAKTVFTYQITW